MSIIELRKKVKKSIDNADEKTLKMVDALLTIDQDYDWWDDLNDEAKASILRAEKNIEEGKVETHKNVMKKHSTWLSK